ncbi:hemerythrin domain-containing protein [Myxococcus sp. CA051A]|nr:hemerythrin domain-containing protein [Myxococcus sp. CA051A]NTX40753.1 hemerythrin domain-containing protein [Myxococcus sp. CA033]NTX63449.1 hemerythrin domain-containing protein [Myxococcus sp. CA051A]
MVEGMGGPFDILVEEHRELEERFERLVSGAEEEPLSAQRELLELLRLHTWLEERCLQPLVARVEGRARARQLAEDHLAMRELMDELEELPLGDAEWQARLYALEDLWVAHFQEEESSLLPRLSTALDPREQQTLRVELTLAREELRTLAEGPFVSGTRSLLEDLRWDG